MADSVHFANANFSGYRLSRNFLVAENFTNFPVGSARILQRKMAVLQAYRSSMFAPDSGGEVSAARGVVNH